MRTLWRALRDPFVGSIVALVALLAGGFIALAIATQRVAASDDVSIQLAYLVSGGIGGLGVIVFALGLVLVQVRRRDEARRRGDLERLIAAASRVLDTAREP